MAMRNKKLSKQELKAFLDAKVVQYNARKFIESDPIQIPHQFNTKEDIEISGFLNPSQLSCPLDVHSGNVARKLGLLKRKQNDGKALLELDTALRKLDPTDPVKYDFALFGLGVFEGF